ncbi:MAG TPA: hypothetical protein VG651_15005 [Stellaceae bacterium]|nr:hypothetical protein [Stellaceae bacterium]
MKFHDKKKRRPGCGGWRDWGADIPTEVFLAPMDEADLDAAEGKFNDEWCVTLPEYLTPKKEQR